MIREDDAGGWSYWPSVSDLFMTLFIVSMALAAVLFVLLPASMESETGPLIAQLRARVAELTRALEREREGHALRAAELARLHERMTELDGTVAALYAELVKERERRAAAEAELGSANAALVAFQQRHAAMTEAVTRYEKTVAEAAEAMNLDKPPIIEVKSREDRFFALGSATLTPEFEADLAATQGAFEQIAAEILMRNRTRLRRVDTLEIIGHTDGIALRRRGNLDTELPSLLSGEHEDMGRLQPGSNNDLGLLRALAIKQAWGRFAARHPGRAELASIEVRTYSAGQTLPVAAGRFKLEDERARRIELRLTQLKGAAAPAPVSGP